MRYGKYISRFALCALAATVFTGCSGNDESKVHYDNKLFITGGSFVRELRVAEGDITLGGDMTIGMAKPESKDITATLAVTPELVDHFRAAYYDPGAELLPAGHYDLTNAAMTIDAGKITSDSYHLEFTDLGTLDMKKIYVLPVTITNANIGVLSGAKTLYYLFREASLVNVVAEILGPNSKNPDAPENNLWPGPADWNNPAPVKDMNAFTLEALVNVNSFDNNEIATIMGIEDRFLVRIGDSGIAKNQLQVAYGGDTPDSRGNITNTSLGLDPGVWYHVAVTFDGGEIAVYIDGQKKASGNSVAKGVTSVDFSVPHSDETDGKPRCFWISHSYDKWRSLNGMISEVRIWNKALTGEEIRAENHFYKVDPASQGLVAYWKFNEGEGDVVKDHTVWGNDLVSALPLKWYPVALPVKE
jgi:hypothetical protein